jgi:hypothetical protein
LNASQGLFTGIDIRNQSLEFLQANFGKAGEYYRISRWSPRPEFCLSSSTNFCRAGQSPYELESVEKSG